VIEAQLNQNKPFPRSILSVSREEFGRTEDNPHAQYPPLELIVKAGSLPTDITGHVFIVGTVGSYDSTYRPSTNIVYPSSDGFTPMYNGDGMIYRLDFDRISEAMLTTRIAKAPCYYADIATSKVATNCQFDNRGITRLSEKLGVRNQLNTAFLPMTFAEGGDRLLVTWDIGRPYEIDPQTLELATPVGWNDEWRAMNPVLADIPFLPPFPFKLIQSSAHPCFDVHTQEMFTVNSGRSLSTFISQLRPLIYGFLALIEVLREPGKLLQVLTSLPSPTSLGKKLSSTFKRFVQFLHNFLQLFNIFTNFVYVIRWDGKSRLQKWKVVHPSGCPVKISQSMHQIGITEDYIVLMDTAFKFLLEELLPPENSRKAVDIERVLRNLLDTPQLPDNNIYIVSRADLIAENKRVVARKAVIPRETAHFLVDYKNSDRQITIHMPHMCAWDPAEWLRDIDWKDDNNSLQRLYGVIVGAMDISRLGCHVIDAETGQVVRSDMTPISQGEDGYTPYTWGPELYAYQENPPSGRLENIYWSCLGAWEELLTEHSIAMYSNYKYRAIPVEEIRSLTQTGIKANLLRLHIAPIESVSESENRLQIQDVYEFESGYFGTSPQFVPIAGKDGSTDGYIVCVVYHDPDNESETGKEIWIFDAKNLSGGAICKLYHPQMNFGFTVHTTWMPKIARRTASYNVPVREDYQAIVSQQPDYIQELFNDWVYPQKEP
jgi:carotenoid cleavage dioxygenase-like enzyme